MTNISKLNDILANSVDGTVTTEQINNAGLHRSVLQKLTDDGALRRLGRGLYIKTDVWEDELYLLQKKYSKGIYSHDTALYLHGYSDKTPAKYTMTFPKGYNAPSLKQENIIIKRSVDEIYSFGVTEVTSPCGNILKVYDIERTLCDIVRGSGNDIQIINSAMKR